MFVRGIMISMGPPLHGVIVIAHFELIFQVLENKPLEKEIPIGNHLFSGASC